MTKKYTNIVPDNNLRLPDALTIKHGPARLLSTFVLEGDKAARRIGVRRPGLLLARDQSRTRSAHDVLRETR
jgi:hypothetical protein